MSAITIKCGAVKVREFVSVEDHDDKSTVIGRKDVVYKRRIDKRHLKIPRDAASLYRDEGNVLMLCNNHTKAQVTVHQNNDVIKVNPMSKCSVATGALIALAGTTEEDILSVEYNFGNNVFTAATEAGSDTEDDEKAHPPPVPPVDADETQLDESQSLPIS